VIIIPSVRQCLIGGICILHTDLHTVISVYRQQSPELW